MSMSARLCACHAAPVAGPFPSGAVPQRPLADGPWPGELQLHVDLTEAPRRVFRIEEKLAVTPGRLELHYPQWVPGEHAPSGPIDGVTGLEIHAGDQRLAWHRDPVDLFTLIVEVPEAVGELKLTFQFLSAGKGGSFGQAVSATADYAVLAWNQVLFYPAGYRADAISCRAAVRLPDGWQAATALPAEGDADGAERRFDVVSLQTLVDSPLLAGRHFRRVKLDDDPRAPVHLNVVADAARHLEWKEEQIECHRRLIREARTLFRSRHYARYEFLLTLSDHTMHFGLEHQQSSDDRLDAEFFTDKDRFMTAAGLMPHEFVHSWNGKFRCPEPTATPTYNTPMAGSLMWVYEGLTTYLGDVLTARCGLWTPAQYRDALAADAAAMAERPGAQWRSLQDTCDAAPRLYDAPAAWSNWRRSVDFYPEGALLWLEIDTRLRILSMDARTLDDFCRGFHGIEDGVVGIRPFVFDDVAAALEETMPGDWADWLRQRLDATRDRVPLAGVQAAGWKLVFTDTPSPYFKQRHAQRKLRNLGYSAGFVVGTRDGVLADVRWQSPAFAAGLAPGMKIVAVDGVKFSPEALEAAISAGRDGTAEIDLLVENIDHFSHHALVVSGGLRYPQLERDGSLPDRLAQILEPLARR